MTLCMVRAPPSHFVINIWHSIFCAAECTKRQTSRTQFPLTKSKHKRAVGVSDSGEVGASEDVKESEGGDCLVFFTSNKEGGFTPSTNGVHEELGGNLT